MGSVIAFEMARRWGQPLVERLVGKTAYAKYAGLFAGRGGLWLLVVFLIPFFPDDVLTLLAGVSGISLRRFVVLVAVGRLPGIVLTSTFTAGMSAGSLTLWLPLAGVAVLALGAGYRYRARLEHCLDRRARSGHYREERGPRAPYGAA